MGQSKDLTEPSWAVVYSEERGKRDNGQLSSTDSPLEMVKQHDLCPLFGSVV